MSSSPLLALWLRALAAAHPMHTSVTELTHDASARTVVVTLRVFADDFGSLAPDRGGAAEQYVRAHLQLTDPGGRQVVLRWAGATLEGDVVRIRLLGDLPSGLTGVRVQATLLCERFPDQVNLVRATYGGRTASLLFTRGDHPKALP